MKNVKMNAIEKYAMVFSTLILCGMFLLYLHNLSPQLKKVEEDYKEA